jgi:acyl-CoA synthetase (AMP-forming)/AMP-acid ligase II
VALIELLRGAAALVPHQPAVVSPRGSTTYAECLDRAGALARGLAARGVDRAACVLSEPADVLALLCASTATGTEICVYPAAADAETIATFTAAFDHRVVVADRGLGDVPGAGAITLDELAEPGAPGSGATPPTHAPALILTTGTTGRPKAVQHDWTRLAGAVRRADDLVGTRWLLAYNLNQFAGIQVLLYVLANHATLVVPASNQPRDALEAMRDLGVTHASATPTFWRFLVALLDDPSAAPLQLRQITLGGEAVPGTLLGQLGRLFPDARISQVYASTEFGSSVSIRDGRNGLPASVLDRSDDADVQFRIVDGELHARSRVGMLGYHGDQVTDDVGWRATGDLVEVVDDRIQFVGRTSEIINVGGVKVHPLPVEELVTAVDGVDVARVYGRTNAVSGQIVAVDVLPRAGVDTEKLDELIREACAALPAAARPRRIRFVDTLELRENKIVRRATEPGDA